VAAALCLLDDVDHTGPGRDGGRGEQVLEDLRLLGVHGVGVDVVTTRGGVLLDALRAAVGSQHRPVVLA